MDENYYQRSEVSNSDLSWLQKFWFEKEQLLDFENAYRFGTLIDCMITEPRKVDFFALSCGEYIYTEKEFATAETMKKSYMRDEFCRLISKHAEFQKVSICPRFPIEWEGKKIFVAARCKWDLYAMQALKITGDIKSTTATSEKQFIDACHHFKYFRQRAWYMDIAKALGQPCDRDMLIGISKEAPHKIFKVPIARGSEVYRIGREQYSELAFLYWSLFL